MKPTAIQQMIEAIEGEVRSSNIGGCPDFAWKTSLEILLEEARRLASLEVKSQAEVSLAEELGAAFNEDLAGGCTCNCGEVVDEILSRYHLAHGKDLKHPAHSTVGIVEELKKLEPSTCESDETYFKYYPKHMIEEIITKFSNEKGGV